MKKICVICGEEGYSYFPFCYKHLQMKNEGKIVKCENCGQWHFSNEPCQCQKKVVYTELPTEGFNACVACGTSTNGYAFCKKCFKKYKEDEMLNMLNKKSSATIEKTEKIDICKESSNPSSNTSPTEDIKIPEESKKQELKIGKCLTCGNDTTDGYLFCNDCYYKYKNKTLLLKVEKCLSVTVQDESYEGIYVCDDGHIVKSVAEREIDNYLYEKGIRHSYEPNYDTGKKGAKSIHPDFKLEQYLGDDGNDTLNGKDTDVYIEYWGLSESFKEYTERKNYKLNIYRENKETLICLYADRDIKDIKFALRKSLRKESIVMHEINGEE